MIRWASIDLDGTLLDTVLDLHAACAAMLVDLGRPPLSVEDTRRYVGKGMRVLVERCLDGEGMTAEALLTRGIDGFRRHYARENGRQASLYPGVREGLLALHEQGVQLSVVTNKPQAFTEPLLAHTGLREFFGVVVSGDTLAEKKPHPAPLLHACKNLGESPLHGLHIGDSRHDMEAAHAAGVRFFLVPYGYADGAPVAAVDMRQGDALVSSLAEAAERVRHINSTSAAPIAP